MAVAISIVIPVYNGDQYIEKTINALLQQTFADFEIICVDDSSTDRSLELLLALQNQDNRVKVFTKPNEGTAAKAILFGLNFVSGSYFMYSSQDDLYSSDLLEKNYSIAQNLNADAVVPDMYFFWDNQELKDGIFGINGDRNLVLSGREAFIYSLDWTIHGFVLWSMSTVRKVGFYDFAMNSDEFTTRMLYINSNRVVFSNGVFYYRQNNVNAITKKWNIRQLECFETSNRLETFLIENNFAPDSVDKIYRTILIDLIRLQIMYLKCKTNLLKADQSSAKIAIKQAYVNNLCKVKSIKPKSFKEHVILKIVSLSYSSFSCYSALVINYRKVRYGNS